MHERSEPFSFSASQDQCAAHRIAVRVSVILCKVVTPVAVWLHLYPRVAKLIRYFVRLSRPANTNSYAPAELTLVIAPVTVQPEFASGVVTFANAVGIISALISAPFGVSAKLCDRKSTAATSDDVLPALGSSR